MKGQNMQVEYKHSGTPMSTRRRKGFTAVITIGVLAIGGAVLAPISASAGTSKYVAVIDAGSSGSRIALFTPGATALAAPQALVSVKSKVPALSSFGSDPANAGAQGVAPLLTDLDSYLVQHKIAHKDVTVSLLATAGMRLLEASNPTAATEVFASSRAAIKGAGFPVGSVKVMSGSDEAMYSWVDANATTGALAQAKPRAAIAEVGGASAQVAFLSNVKSGKGVHVVKLGAHSYPVVALSYLGLGVNEARLSMSKLAGNGLECFPNNTSDSKITTYEVVSGVSVDAAKSHYVQDSCALSFDHVVGTVGANATNAATTGGLAPQEVRKLPGFDQAKFMGVSAVSFSMKDFGVKAGSESATQLKAQANATCSGTDAWPKVVAQLGGSTGAFTQAACANATYINSYVFGPQGLGVHESHFQPSAASSQDEPSWSRGFALVSLDATKKKK